VLTLALFEVLLGVRQEVLVARVLDGLDPDDSRDEVPIVLMHVLDQLELCRRRADDEDLLTVLERQTQIVKESQALLLDPLRYHRAA
jgi:hypothetical protein